MNKILLENAHEAWSSAIGYCNDILSGKSTLQYQKSFVSSLHNAVELFLKQIMLDAGDHSVARIHAIKNADDAQLALDYMKAQNLNAFFDNLPADKLRKFRTIEFSELIDLHRKILNKSLSQTDTLKNELAILQNLRNNETHFLIRQNSFLSESDFCSLHNLMVRLYQILEDYDLLGYWGIPWNEDTRLTFDREILQDFSYSDAVRNSPLVKELAKILTDSCGYGTPEFSPYSIACDIVRENPKYESRFRDVWTMIEMMLAIDMIKIIETEEEPDSPDSYPKIHYITEVI